MESASLCLFVVPMLCSLHPEALLLMDPHYCCVLIQWAAVALDVHGCGHSEPPPERNPTTNP